MLTIHHHFRFSKALLDKPARFNGVVFESIPFFQIYPIRDLPRIRNVIDALRAPMPPRLQKIMKGLLPPPQIADSKYRTELVLLTFCKYKNQSFFVRVYQLRHNDFYKAEVTIHSSTRSEDGKHYNLEKTIRSAESFFSVLDKEVTPLNPLGRHLDEYFFVEDFRKEVGVFERELAGLKKAKSRRAKEALKRRLTNSLKDFQENAKGIAAERLSSFNLDEAVHARLDTSRQLVK